MRAFLISSVALTLLVAGCSSSARRPSRGTVDGGGDVDAGMGFDSGGEFDLGMLMPGDGAMPDVGPNLDAFFAMDPPPMQCLPDGGMGTVAEPPGGTPDCPADKNREGCPCENVGETAPCWPGLRVDRDRGICQDGTTTCQPYDEFWGRWGACTGAILPVEGATIGPNACNCFSAGQWQIDNLSPCFVSYSETEIHAVSTMSSTGACPADPGGPPPVAVGPWSASRLTVDCAGAFHLCYTLKAGRAETASPSDCTVARVCVDTWYETPGATQELPMLPGFPNATSPDNAACARQFALNGGYGEMSVQGTSVECDPIDNGSGGEYVFSRNNYCPADCADRPTDPDCTMCSSGGSGSF